jgi:outer membrane immunogenic protein
MQCKGLLLATVSSLAIASAVTVAAAADLPARVAPIPVKAPIVAAAYDWTGFYIGIHGGGAWLDHNQRTSLNNGSCNTVGAGTTANCSLTAFGGIVGGFAGYNLQSGRVVYGIEADGSWTGLKKSVSTPDSAGLGNGLTTLTGRVDWLATVRGRIGITMSPTLLYVTGGVAFGGVKSSWTDNDPPPNTNAIAVDKVKVGWVAGGGIEHAFAGNWRVRVEGLYHDLGKVSVGPVQFPQFGNAYSTTFRHQVATVRGGVALRW